MLQKINYSGTKPQISNVLDDYLNSFLNQNLWIQSNRKTQVHTGNEFPIDMFSDKENLYVNAQIPGVSKDKINVELIKNDLSIEVSNRHDQNSEASYFVREIPTLTAKRTMKLPKMVISKNVKSTYNDGILRITLPMSEPEPRQQIPVH